MAICINNTIDDPGVQAKIQELETQYKDKTIIIGVDRMDYTDIFINVNSTVAVVDIVAFNFRPADELISHLSFDMSRGLTARDLLIQSMILGFRLKSRSSRPSTRINRNGDLY
jgi:hypothetical protein